MKHFFFCVLAALATISMISRAEAKDPEDAESDHVIVTLKSGEKVDCYVHRGWHAENSVFKKENYSFKVTKTPDGKEPIEYTADDVVSIDYIETTADHPDGLRWESHPLAKPNFASRYHTMQVLFCVNKVGKKARPPGGPDAPRGMPAPRLPDRRAVRRSVPSRRDGLKHNNAPATLKAWQGHFVFQCRWS